MVPQTGSPTPFPKLGIKLSYLLTDFLAMCGGRAALEGKTTGVPEENHRVGKTVLLRVFEWAAAKPSHSRQGNRVHLSCMEVLVSRCNGCAAKLIPLRPGHYYLVRRFQREPARGVRGGFGLWLMEQLLQVGHPGFRPRCDGASPLAGSGPSAARLVSLRDLQHHLHWEQVRSGDDGK